MKASNLFRRFLLTGYQLALPVIAGLFATVLSARADGLDTWHWRNPLPSGDQLRSVAFGNGVFVAVGLGGLVQTSTDGITWVPSMPIATKNLNRVVFLNGQFVAVGDAGTILLSADGSQWSPQNSGTTNALYAATYGNSKLVVSGAGGTVLVLNNSTWTVGNVGAANTLDWIAFGNGVFTAPTPPPTGFPAFWPPASVLVSADAINWTTNAVPTVGIGGRIFQTVFGGNKFLSYIDVTLSTQFGTYTPYFYSSTLGTAWTQETNGPTLTPAVLTYINNHFTVVGRIYNGITNVTCVNMSLDGATWTSTQLSWDFAATDIAYGEGQYVLVGPAGLVMNSPNGTNWTLNTTGPQNRLSSLATGQGVTVAVGSALPFPGTGQILGFPAPILVSTNGSTFAPATSTSTNALTAVAFGATNFVAVGLGGILHRSTNANATGWGVRPSATSSDLAAICYGNGRWIGVGASGAIITSTNTLTWSLRTSGTSESLFGVTYGSGMYVAVGAHGTILTSPDSINWEPQFTDTLSSLYRIVYGNGQFVAVGESGAVITSTDGFNWVTQASGTTAALYGLSYGFGSFLAAGVAAPSGYYDQDNNVLIKSLNGTSWQAVLQPTTWNLSDVHFSDGTFWLVGGNGTILQSDNLPLPPSLTGRMLPVTGYFELTIHRTPGETYTIKYCDQPGGGVWFDALTVSNCPATKIWVDTNVAASAIRLYRVTPP